MRRILFYDLKIRILNLMYNLDCSTMSSDGVPRSKVIFLQLLNSLILATPVSFTALLFETMSWIKESTLIKLSNEKGFIIIIFILISSDSLTGIIKHIDKKTFNAKKLAFGTILKYTIAGIFAIMFHSIVYIADADTNVVGATMLLTGRLIIGVWISSSISWNLYTITNKKFPPKALMNKFDKFNESLNISDLTETKQASDVQ